MIVVVITSSGGLRKALRNVDDADPSYDASDGDDDDGDGDDVTHTRVMMPNARLMR